MSHFAGKLDFPAETLNFMSALYQFDARRLQCNSFVELEVFGFIDFAHSAARQKAQHFKSAGQHVTGEKRGDWRGTQVLGLA
jgi:hypothetical protein